MSAAPVFLTPEAGVLSATLEPATPAFEWVYDDGGRAEAGFRGFTGDCVTRAIAIGTGLPYRDVYDELHRRAARSPRRGVHRPVYDKLLRDLGWQWTATMHVGAGTTVHVRPDELPPEPRMILRLSRHVVAVVDGKIRDLYDPSRSGTRCVYGYYTGEPLTSPPAPGAGSAHG